MFELGYHNFRVVIELILINHLEDLPSSWFVRVPRTLILVTQLTQLTLGTN